MAEGRFIVELGVDTGPAAQSLQQFAQRAANILNSIKAQAASGQINPELASAQLETAARGLYAQIGANRAAGTISPGEAKSASAGVTKSVRRIAAELGLEVNLQQAQRAARAEAEQLTESVKAGAQAVIAQKQKAQAEKLAADAATNNVKATQEQAIVNEEIAALIEQRGTVHKELLRLSQQAATGALSEDAGQKQIVAAKEKIANIDAQIANLREKAKAEAQQQASVSSEISQAERRRLAAEELSLVNTDDATRLRDEARREFRQFGGPITGGGAGAGGGSGGGGRVPPVGGGGEEPIEGASRDDIQKIITARRNRAIREIRLANALETELEAEGENSVITREGIARALFERVDQLRKAVQIEATTEADIRLAAENQAALASQSAQQRAIKEQALSEDEKYIQALAATARAQQEIQRKKQIELGATPQASVEEEAQAANLRRVNILREQIATLQAQLGVEVENLESETSVARLEGLQRALKSQQNQIIKQQTEAEAIRLGFEEQQVETQRQQAGLFQRLFFRARGGGREGGGPNFFRPQTAEEAPTLRQFVGREAVQLGGFALAGGVLFGAVNAVKSLVQNGQQLQVTFSQIRRQFDEIGQGNQFEGFKRSILDISRSTGEAANDVAQVAATMKAAFGDTQLAIDNTTSSIKLARVSGLSLTEVKDSVVAIGKAFGVTAEEVGNAALGVRERFGVAVPEVIKFLGDIAPVAAHAGFTVEQIGNLAGVAARNTGKSVTAVAENFNRIFPELQKNFEKLLQIPGIRLNPKDIAQGNIRNVFESLIRQYNGLSQASKNALAEQLGGRRDAQALIAVFESQKEALDALNKSTDDAGKLNRYFGDLQKTLKQRLDELRAAFQQLGEALLRAGLGQLLRDVLTIGGTALKILSAIAGALAFLADKTHGVTVRLLEFLVALKTVQAFSSFRQREAAAIAEGVAGEAAAAVPLRRRLLRRVTGVRAPAELTLEQEFAAIQGNAIPTQGRAARALGAVKGGLSNLRNVFTEAGGGLDGLRAAAASSALVQTGVIFLAFQAMTSLFETIGKEREKARKAASDLRTKLRTSLSTPEGLERAQRVAETREGGLSAAPGAFLRGDISGGLSDILRGPLGLPTAQGVVRQELKKRQLAQEQRLADALKEAGAITDRQYKQLIKDIQKGDVDAAQKIINEVYKKQPKLSAGAVREAAQQQGVSDAAAKAQADAEAQLADLQKVQAQYQAGQVSLDAYVAAIQKNINLYKQILANDPNNAEAAQKLAELQKQLTDATDTALREQFDISQALLQATGQQSLTQRLTATIQLAQQLQDPKAKSQALKDAVGQLRGLLDNALGQFGNDAEDNLKLLQEGVAVPPEVAAALRAAGQPVPNRIKGSPEEIKKAQDQAKDERRQASEALAKAQNQLLQAQDQNDPVALARAQLSAADQSAKFANAQLNRATSESERLNAQAAQNAALAERVRAEKTLEQAMFDVTQSRLDLAKAVAEAAGNTVEVARIGLQQAEQRLAELRKTSPNDEAGINRARADVETARRSAEDAVLQQREDDINFGLEIGTVTRNQAIQMLQSLLTIPTNTKKQNQEIQLKIKQLRDELGQNFQFNLPSEFRLPTLYESRRLVQSGQAGAGYQDNRNVQVTLYVNNGMDQVQAQSFLADALGTNRFGVTPRRY